MPASSKALELVASRPDLRARLTRNTRRFREGMVRSGFRITPGEHPIIPVMLGDAHLAARLSERMLEEGIYVIGFALETFAKVGRELGVM